VSNAVTALVDVRNYIDNNFGFALSQASHIIRKLSKVAMDVLRTGCPRRLLLAAMEDRYVVPVLDELANDGRP